MLKKKKFDFSSISYVRSVLVGSNEEIPGLAMDKERGGPYLPWDLGEKQIVKEEQNKPINLVNIMFEFPKAVDDYIKNKMIQLEMANLGLQDNSEKSVFVEIKNKRFVMAFHNSWAFINEKGL